MLVELVRLAAGVGPVEDEVGGRDVLDAQDVGVERVFPGPSGSAQTPLWPFATMLPCLKSSSAHIRALVTVVADDDADGADGNLRHRDFLDVDEPGVEEIRSC